MFYTDYLAYNKVPSKEEIAQVKNAGKKIAIFDNGSLPKYILEDVNILIMSYSVPALSN